MEIKNSESRVFFENFTKRVSVILSKMYSQISPVYLVSVMEILLAIFIFCRISILCLPTCFSIQVIEILQSSTSEDQFEM